MARLRIVALGALLLAGILATAVTVWSRVNADTTTKVDVNDVARQAHADAIKHVARGLRPAPGTYTYRVSGTERVSALGGAEHTFGPEAAAVVRLEGTGCAWSINFIYAKEHQVTYRMCTEASGTKLQGVTTSVTFFGHDERIDQPCAGAGGMLVPASAKPGTDGAPFTCRNDERTTEHHPSVVAAAKDAPQLAGIDPATLTFVRDAIVVGGTAKGTNPIDAVFTKEGLPVAIHEQSTVRSPSILGDTDYRLDLRAELVSATPK